jgi:magnesium chelatase subunit D
MMAGDPPDPIEDALLAVRLLALAPHTFGGIVLRGASPARDAVVEALRTVLPLRRMPGHVDDERLLGGIDIAASLAAGRPMVQTGLIEEARGGALLAAMAERIGEALAGRLAQARDEGGPALVLLDDGTEEEDRPPPALIERCAFLCDCTHSRVWQIDPLPAAMPLTLAEVAPLGNEALEALAGTAAALGIASLRPLLFAAEAARGHAALMGRTEASQADLAAAVRLVLAPRATQLPPVEDDQTPSEEPPQPPPPDDQSEGSEDQSEESDKPLADLLVEAAAAAIPADLLVQLIKGNAPRRSASSGSGKRKKSGLRGKPLGARPGMPRGGARLALIDTLRAAVPWQQVRRRELGLESGANPDAPIQMRKDDLRVRRFEEKAARVTIFAVDASGSAAAARLAEAKGAVELMLAQAYVTRSEVALIAFRGERAEVLLPPTRSLTRARRALAELPGGGGTPLALGLNAAREVAMQVAARGRSPALVILTDGRANLDANGQPGRKQANEDAEAAARVIARAGYDALVVDISARPGREGPALAQAMEARFLALPRADARALHQAISAIQPGRGAA